MKKDTCYILVHGHFYQPPRENPWSGQIPRQPSAAPYHDWNYRITSECYSANGSSRRLDGHGAIENIENNYRWLSFNFGPTLLSWMEQKAPQSYQRIIQGDKDSAKFYGGPANGICQAFNHSILPLADHEDQKTQVRWGLADFKRRFGRPSKGIWLPEAAINDDVAQLLIDEGIEFTILSPFQARSIRREGQEKWQKLKHGAPCDRAFKWKGKGGDLSILFYDPNLASGISFQHYLKDADQLLHRFRQRASEIEGNLISVATDGEIYGHHEAFGDMCLAAFANKVNQSGDLEFINAQAYLEKFPPQWEVILQPGEDHRGSSWSCHHGVSRWYKDCGCHTGGDSHWNQKWRVPLKQAFQRLNRELKVIYRVEMSKLSGQDPMDLRNLYGEVLSGQISRRDFLDKYGRPELSTKDRQRMLNLLEGQRFSQYMFTSCGWFFSELAGLEPLQNMKYAARAMELYQPFSKKNLKHLIQPLLIKAKSNIHEKGNGWDLFLQEALTESQHISRSVAHFLFQEIYGIKGSEHQGCYHYHHLIINRGMSGEIRGSLMLEQEETQEEYHFDFQLIQMYDGLLESLQIKDRQEEEAFIYHMKDLPLEIRRAIYYQKKKEDLSDLMHYLQDSYGQLISCFRDHQEILPEGDPLTHSTLKASLQLALSSILEETDEKGLHWMEERGLSRFEEMLLLSHELQLPLEEYHRDLCSKIIAFEVENFLEYKDPVVIERLHCFIRILWRNRISAVKPYSQNLVYHAFHRHESAEWREAFLKDREENSVELLLKTCQQLSQIMNIRRDVLIQREDLISNEDIA